MGILAKLHVYGPKSNKAAEEALAPAREAAGLGKRALESVGLRWTFDPDQPRERGEWSKAVDIKGGEKAAAEVKAAGRADRIKSFGTGWHVADPPRYSHMKEWDCQVCGVETLKKPVFLEKDGQRVCAGTGCATSLVGMGDRPGAKAGIERRARREAERCQASSCGRPGARTALPDGTWPVRGLAPRTWCRAGCRRRHRPCSAKDVGLRLRQTHQGIPGPRHRRGPGRHGRLPA